MGGFRLSRDGDRDPNVWIEQALGAAEDALARNDHRGAIKAIDGATGALGPRPVRSRRFAVIVATALVVAVFAGGAAFATRGTGRPQNSASLQAIRVADRMLRAADRVNDTQALRELVDGVQDTIAELAPNAAADRRVEVQLGDLAKRQEEILSNKSGVPADLLARAHELVQTLTHVTPKPSPAVPSVSAPSPGTALP
jgi:hypothetical protein